MVNLTIAFTGLKESTELMGDYQDCESKALGSENELNLKGLYEQDNHSELLINVQRAVEEEAAEESQLKRGYHISYPY